MDKDPLTIIVPVYNELARARELSAYLDTLGCAVIVVDGYSTDGTYGELRQSAGSRTTIIRAPRGRATQMNAGAALATTTQLLFLHADTTLPDNGIDQVRRALRETGLWGRFDLSFDQPTPLLVVVAWFMNQRSALSGICTGDQAIFVTARLFRMSGGYCEIPLMEDIELSARLKRTARPVRLRTPVITAARRWQVNGPLRTIAKMWSLRLRYWLGETPESLAKRYNHAR